MVLPKQQSIELPLLKVLADSGGQLPTSVAIERVTSFFPEITAEDLGLYQLHFQAKRWKNQVGAEEIRGFIGGMQTSHHTEYGIFVTTSDFSKDAVETGQKSGKVKLINGRDFAALMIKYGLGVTKSQLHVAKIDHDYFEGL